MPYIQSIAVIVFFALSGFTIAWVCDRSSGSGLGGFINFAYDRFMRLAIPLVPVLIIFTALEVALISPDPYAATIRLKNFVGNVFFLQVLTLQIPFTNLSYSPGIVPLGINHPLWTLSVEFWCYVTFAGFFYASRSRGIDRLRSALCGGFGVCLLTTFIEVGGLPVVWAGGAALYFILKAAPPLGKNIVWAAMALMIAFLIAAGNPTMWPENGQYSYRFNASVFAVFACAMVISSLTTIHANTKSVVVHFSLYAYTVYLVHYPTLFLLQALKVLPRHSSASALLGVIASLVIAWVLYLPFERNYRVIRDRLRSAITRRRKTEDAKNLSH